jgi:hypothetical protein
LSSLAQVVSAPGYLATNHIDISGPADYLSAKTVAKYRGFVQKDEFFQQKRLYSHEPFRALGKGLKLR